MVPIDAISNEDEMLELEEGYNSEYIDDEDINTTLEIDEEEPNIEDKTYYINFEKKRIQGEIDGLEAVKQSIIAILSTERYAYLIHSWDYGSSLEQYIGQDYEFITADIGREIKEALLTDDRIIDVDNFTFEKKEENLKVNFEVNTLYGVLSIEKSVVI